MIAFLWEGVDRCPLVTVVNLGPHRVVVPVRVSLLPVRGRSVVLTDLLSPGPTPFAVAGPGDDLAGIERLRSPSKQFEGRDRWEYWWEANRAEFLRSALSDRYASRQ